MLQLVTYRSAQGIRTGLMQNDKIYASGRYASMQDVLDDWVQASERLPDVAQRLADRSPETDVELLAPLPAPRNIYFAGANYKDHVAEMKRRLGLPLDEDPKAGGQSPWFSTKATGSTVVGPGARVERPRGTRMLDWELELAVVIGRRCKDVPVERALDVVAGYTVANDLSARDHIAREGVPDDSPFRWDWIGQKTFDGSCPLGPAITPAAFIPDPHKLQMRLWVNGELMQDSNTGQMIYDVREQIAHLSSCVTLLPGDVILTGTPAGVGMARNRFLQPGDVVRQWIESIGVFEITIG